MTRPSVIDQEGKSARAWLGRPRRNLVLAAIGSLAIGAFLFWGPVGLGNGPLTAAEGGTAGGADSAVRPVGFVIPFRNAADAQAVVDGVDLIGGTRYAAPRLLRLDVLTSGRCGGAWPARQAAHGFVFAGCGGSDTGPLIGHAVGRVHGFFGFPAAAEVAGPAPGSCWVITKIVVHYHVGIRHYSASDPYQLAVCAEAGQVKAAMNDAEGAG
jgi:hypothetical protein